MDEYLDEGESYEDSQEYARVATEKLKLDAERERERKPYPRNLPEYPRNLPAYPRNLPEYPRNLPPHSELVAERKEIEARMLEIEDMENPSEEDLDNLQSLESRYFEITGTFGAEKWTPGPALPALIATDTSAPSIGSSQKERTQFPAEALEELKKHIIVFTGAGMMLSVFAAMGGFLLGRRTKEC